MKKVSFARKLLDTVLSFFFALIVFAFIVVTVTLDTLFSPDFYISQVESSGFSENAVVEIRKLFVPFLKTYDIPQELTTDRITVEVIDEAIKQTITSSFNNTESYDFHLLVAQIFGDIKEYLQNKYPVLPPDIDEQLAVYSSQSEEALNQYINTPIFQQVATMAKTYRPALRVGQMGLGVVAAVFLICLLWSCPGWAEKVRGLIVAFSVLTALNLICFSARLLPTRLFLNSLRLTTSNNSLRLFVTQCINGAIAAFNWPLIVSASLLAILIVVSLLIRRTDAGNVYN